MWLIWVNQPHACFGLVVSDERVVIDAAPIARYTIGWQATRAKHYFRAKGAEVAIMPIGV